LTCVEKFRNAQCVDKEKICKEINDCLFTQLTDLGNEFYEVPKAKRVVNFDLPVQIGFFVFNYAKLQMLKFYYDCIDKFISRKDYCYAAMDTDSAYWALAHHDCMTLFDRKNCKNFTKSTSSGLSAKLAIRTKTILFKRVQTVMRGCLFVKSAQNRKSIIREHLVFLKLSGREKALSLSAVKRITVPAKKIN